MEKIKRYSISNCGLEENENGNLVLFEHYKKLLDENKEVKERIKIIR